MNQPATSTSSGKSTESAQVRLRLWRERFVELLHDLEAFLPENAQSFEDSRGVPASLSCPSDSQAS